MYTRLTGTSERDDNSNFVPIIDVGIISNGIFKWILWQILSYAGDHVGIRFVNIATMSEFGGVYVILIMISHHLVPPSPILEIVHFSTKRKDLSPRTCEM